MSEWVLLAFVAGVAVGIVLTGVLAERFMESKFREAGLLDRWRHP